LKRAGSAVELRPAPKARNPAHPQERQHSAAAGGTRDRVRRAGALRRGGHAARVRDRNPNGRRRSLLVMTARVTGRAAPGATRLEPDPKGTRQEYPLTVEKLPHTK
jgi:hypothetical protein